MRKFLFWLLLIIGVILSFRIGRILLYDLHWLTSYGFGYLAGLIILFLIIISITVILGFKIYKKNQLHNKINDQ